MDLYHTTDMDGISELNPDDERMEELIQQLDMPDFDEADHPDLALVHDVSGWSLTLYPNGVVTYENFDDDDDQPRYMTGIKRDKALHLWKELARGDIEGLKQLPWLRDEV
ncbi:MULTISPECIES: hypothetical protein [unclassified Lentimonas]|uniref:hypothetical protein n=1 Tax=unclassified Lentimonas TaxID=2630993 RepID=UPI00132C41A9|nr:MULTISPECIES: hypothetical protein [unclassified Lentimonas]CAA6677838.1 Unannotated [Lentimonas sp. CC4]CAA6683940.1 Unannotated [Lentimonas sp. CC6]CAA7076682.1 Unannotated [Lentimonas sp. CC4]CAA7169988.1 Unannotated [Lentimonas sp. CC21]CAA7181273.1 Unannotated [Lentimonas sp. CC8]